MTTNKTEVTDEQWAELSQDLPARDDPFILKYLEGREALIAEEKKRRSGLVSSGSATGRLPTRR